MVRNLSGIFFENSILIFLDDFWLLLVIPDYRKQSACGHVAVQWFRRRNVFVFVRNFQKWSGICQKSFFENSILIFLDDFWLLLVIPDYRKQSACGHVFGININLSPQPRPD